MSKTAIAPCTAIRPSGRMPAAAAYQSHALPAHVTSRRDATYHVHWPHGNPSDPVGFSALGGTMGTPGAFTANNRAINEPRGALPIGTCRYVPAGSGLSDVSAL